MVPYGSKVAERLMMVRKEDPMRDIRYADYSELNLYCKCEGLDTEHFLYEIRKSKKFKPGKVIQIMISLFR